MSDQYNDQHNEPTKPEGEYVEQFGAEAEKAHLAAGEKFTPEQLGDAVLKFATETAYAAAGAAQVLAEKAKEFYETQRQQIAEQTPEGVDPNFRQFVDAMPDQFKGFFDEATKAFHDLAERGRHTVADFQGQVVAARDAAREARSNAPEAFDLKDDAAADASAAEAVAPEDGQGVVGDAPGADPFHQPVTEAYPGESKDEPRS